MLPVEEMKRFHLERVVELFNLGVGSRTTKSILLDAMFLQRLARKMFGFAVTVLPNSDI